MNATAPWTLARSKCIENGGVVIHFFGCNTNSFNGPPFVGRSCDNFFSPAIPRLYLYDFASQPPQFNWR